jgi:hypothetical protein
MHKPTVPMTAVEPVLMYRASCHCGWWTVTGSDEKAAKVAVILHALVTRCDGCAEEIDHASAMVVGEEDRAGVFCGFCAPHYAEVA